MKRRSIRWQLPLSYASVALVAALSLTLILLTVLRSYYTSQELSYLQDNARAAADIVVRQLGHDETIYRVDSQLRGLAFFSDTRIRYVDSNQELVADSGEPQQYWFRFFDDSMQITSLDITMPGSVVVEAVPGADFTNTASMLSNADIFTASDLPDIAFVDKQAEQSNFTSPTSGATFELVTPDPADQASGSQTFTLNFPPQHAAEEARRQIDGNQGDFFPIDRTIYGINVSGTTPLPGNSPRSSKSVELVIFDNSHLPIGTIRVSDGPAYGTEIINTVTSAGLIAGGISITIAALVGWLMSLRLTHPLIALTEATTQMAAGDLTVRTKVHRDDELGKLSTSFNHMAERIENTVFALRLFVADAAHELHTPLTALRTNLELALESDGGAASQRALQQVARLQSLADNLLDLSRIEAQSGPEDPQLLDLKPMVAELSTIYASEADQRETDFVLNLPDESVHVIGDRVQLQRLIGNLLDNAVKFTTEGSVSLSLQCDRRFAVVCVSDTGIGIPSDELPHLFERFRRGRNTSNYPGSGLGLAIAKAIVTAHGGTISAQSDGPGTTMTVTLPIADK